MGSLLRFAFACMLAASLSTPVPCHPQERSEDGTKVGARNGSVFIVGGIHQSHQTAQTYTYERMGEIYRHLRPDVLCIEVEQKFVDDGSDRGMPFDFQKHMVPLARKDGRPIVGIDWWDSKKGERWEQLQREAFADPALAAEVRVAGGIFDLLNDYFQEKDFEEVNSPEITGIWAAHSDFKYKVLRQRPAYAFIAEFEQERNQHMLENILAAVQKYPDRRILVGVGIDHKYYLERELRKQGVRVLEVDQVMKEWWK